MPRSPDDEILTGRELCRQLLAIQDRLRLVESEDPLEVAMGIEIALRSAHLVAFDHLSVLTTEFPATIQALMTRPDARIDQMGDSILEPHDHLSFRDILDLLSHEDEPCTSPRLHRGWQDKTQSCRQSRRIGHKAVGFVLDQASKEKLSTALAIHNRVFLLPPPVILPLDAARASLAELVRFTSRFDPGD